MNILGNTFKYDLNQFLRVTAPYLCVALVLIIILVIVLIIVKSNERKGKDEKIDKLQTTNGGDWVVALGGKENIQEATAVGSRLTVTLVNQELMNQDKLKELGVSNIMTMSNKVILVIEDHAAYVAVKINKEIKE